MNKKIIDIMNVNIQIPDEAMRFMLSTGRRLQGTISLANAQEGNFHPHHRSTPSKDPSRVEMMLRCGKAVATRKKLRLWLDVNRDGVEFPVMTIMNDCREAREFFEECDD